MKYLLIVLILGFSSSNLLSPRQEKKMVKFVERVWDSSSLEIAEIEFNVNSSDYDQGHYYKIESEGKILGYALGRRIIDNYLNYFPLFVFNEEFEVALVGILEMNTLKGAEINSKRWLKQFIGYNGETIKYGTDIDAVSGATLSGISMVKEVKKLQELLSNHQYVETGKVIGQ